MPGRRVAHSACIAPVSDGFIGLLVGGGETHLDGESKILMTTQQALAFGAALGAALALIGFLLGRLKK